MTDETKTADAPTPNAVQTTGSEAIPAEELARITEMADQRALRQFERHCLEGPYSD